MWSCESIPEAITQVLKEDCYRLFVAVHLPAQPCPLSCDVCPLTYLCLRNSCLKKKTIFENKELILCPPLSFTFLKLP